MANREPRHCGKGRRHSPDVYRELAELAETHGVAFEWLARKHEEGRMTPQAIREELERGRRFTPSGRDSLLLPAADGWVLTPQAEKILPGIMNALRNHGETTLRRMPRGRTARTARGCGWLWRREDIERVKQLRISLHISIPAALKVFDARSRGDL